MTDTTGMVPDKPLLDLIILDCPDALELATFYARVLGWALEDGSDKDWANLVPPGGGLSPDNPDGRAALSFQRIDDFVRPTWPGGAHPQQFHLDLWAGDIDHHEPAVLAAGATGARAPALGERRLPGLHRPGRPPVLPPRRPHLLTRLGSRPERWPSPLALPVVRRVVASTAARRGR